MKRNIFLISIILILLLASSCGLEPMEEGRSVNEYIFPYVFFELSTDKSYYTATIPSGADIEKVYIPGYVDYFKEDVPVKEFAGFENPDDAINLKEIRIDASVEKISEDAFEKAINLEKIIIVGEKDEEGWSNLPTLKVAGKHFHEWKITDEGAEALMYELTHYEAKDPTCTEDGNIEYLECPDCGKLFLDSTAENETTEDKVIIKALGHKFPLEKVEESESTCFIHGYKEHWYCGRCGQLFLNKDGTQKTTQEEVTKPFAHVWDEGWQSDDEYHWHVCEKGCGATTEKEKHKEVLNYDTKNHWYECSVCGRHLSESEAHIFTVSESGTFCEQCGYVYDNTESRPGFDVEPVYEDPTGEISSSYDKKLNKWTFTLVPTNQKSLPAGWEWYVDGEAVDGANTATFEFTPPSEESYVIFCMFWNDKGAGSSEVNI